jgi:hypothetical protein
MAINTDGSFEYSDVETRQFDGRINPISHQPLPAGWLGELREQLGLDPGWPGYPDDEALAIAREWQRDREGQERLDAARRVMPYRQAMDHLRLAYPSIPIMPLPHQAISMPVSAAAASEIILPDTPLLAMITTTVDTWVSVSILPETPGAAGTEQQWLVSSSIGVPILYHVAGVKSIKVRAVQIDGHVSVQYWVR